MTDAHSPLAPSSAARWVVCPGSVKLEVLYPEDPGSEASREGTAAHHALEQVLTGHAVAAGQITPDGHVLTDEMVEGAEDVLRWVHGRIAWHGGEQPRFYVEQRVPIERVHGQCWGTLDLALYFPAARMLYVRDYKFGHGWVEVYENWQLLCYLAGMLQLLNLEGSTNDLAIELGITQPRAFHPDGTHRSWRITVAESRPYAARLFASAQAAMQPDAPLVVNPECKHCQARHACPALQAAGLDAMDLARTAVPFDLPPHALGLELANVRRAIKALEARETGLAGQADALIKSGTRVPFWAIESKPGNRRWTLPAAEVITLGKLLGVDLAKLDAIVTPTQAIERGIDERLLADFSERPNGAANLVLRDDISARKIFS